MCGLAGVAQAATKFPTAERFHAAVSRLRHRGPDAQGLFWAPEAGIARGHARLSIIDPDPRSNQPFRTERCVLAFNGEIYNFRRLRRELEAAGAVFRTTGDTEVIAVGYQYWGLDLFRRLQGMFAIALFDRLSGEVHLARDMFGIKPLYLAPLSAGGFVFASEIKAVAALRGLTLSFETLVDTSVWGFPLSLDSTYAEVSQVAPGSIVTLDQGPAGWRAIRRCSKSADGFYGTSGASAADVREALTVSVRDHLIADVPVAVALSGGIDSSMVAALAARERSDLTAITTTYEEGDDPEVEHARLLCRRYGLKHEVLRLATDDLEGRLRTICRHLEEPIANINVFLSYELARATRDMGFKVILMGEGSDELFAGYPWHRYARQPELQAHPGALFDAYLRRRGSEGARAYLRPAALAASEQRTAVQRAQFVAEFEAGAGSPLDRLLRYDQAYQLQFSQLQRVDRMFMAHGVEARVPYLYDEVLAVSAALPDAERISQEGEGARQRTEKIALGEAARGLLPDEIVKREKFGKAGTVNLWTLPLMAELPRLLDACAASEKYREARSFTSEWLDWDLVRSEPPRPKDQLHLVMLQLCADMLVGKSPAEPSPIRIEDSVRS